MSYRYHGTSDLIKTGETITVLPSGLIQKKVTVVKRKTLSVNSASQIQPLSESESSEQLETGFFPYPTSSSGVDLNNGFVQYEIVGYKKGDTGGINYKYRKLTSFIKIDQYSPETIELFVEVGVSSTVVLSEGVKSDTTDPNGNATTTISYEQPQAYSGQLNAYNADGSIFVSYPNLEVYNLFYNGAAFTTKIKVEYVPIVTLDSVSSNYYGKFTEYIANSSVKIIRKVLEQTTTED